MQDFTILLVEKRMDSEIGNIYNFTYRILKLNIGKSKSNVEYIVHAYI